MMLSSAANSLATIPKGALCILVRRALPRLASSAPPMGWPNENRKTGRGGILHSDCEI
jgi:hypothetical protein